MSSDSGEEPRYFQPAVGTADAVSPRLSRVDSARLKPRAAWECSANPPGFSPALLRGGAGLRAALASQAVGLCATSSTSHHEASKLMRFSPNYWQTCARRRIRVSALHRSHASPSPLSRLPPTTPWRLCSVLMFDSTREDAPGASCGYLPVPPPVMCMSAAACRV